MIRTSDKIFIPFMALGLEEDAPPDMGGRLCTSRHLGGGRPRVWTIFFLHYKKSISIIIFFANLYFSGHSKEIRFFM